ncbi:hypothetical protein B566_EDAN012579, partial [Ephemera danica]
MLCLVYINNKFRLQFSVIKLILHRRSYTHVQRNIFRRSTMKGHSVIFLVLLAITCACVNGQGEGCAPYMSYPDHTMCIYYDDACPNGDLKRSGELTCEEKHEVLDEHNRLRSQVATGNVAGQPAAENMAEM